jgi:hypothetical protein
VRLALSLLLAGEAAGCLLYTDRINHAPTVTLRVPARIDVGQEVSYTADAADPDQDARTLVFEWWLNEGPCGQAGPARSGDHIDGGRGVASATVKRQKPDPFCLSVFVTDDAQAEASDSKPGQAANQPPTAAITVVSPKGAGPYPLYGTLELSGAGKDPEQGPVTLVWSQTVAGQSVTPRRCEGSDHVCIPLDQPGPGAVTLQATDDAGQSGTATFSWTTAEDRAPCIGHTTPEVVMGRIIHDTTKDGPLDVRLMSADDDGDPYPSSGQSMFPAISFAYRWDFDPPAAAIRAPVIPGSDAHVYFPLEFLESRRTHDLIVRLTYADRVARTGCPDDADFCQDRPGCYQRVTWTITIL